MARIKGAFEGGPFHPPTCLPWHGIKPDLGNAGGKTGKNFHGFTGSGMNDPASGSGVSTIELSVLLWKFRCPQHRSGAAKV